MRERERELTMVSRPDVRLEMRSLPARAQTMVLWAPDTAGPWSAVTIRHISMNWQAYLGNLENTIVDKGSKTFLSSLSFPFLLLKTD